MDEILARDGSWTIWRNKHGFVGLTHEARGKSHDVSEAPRWKCPAWLAKKYVRDYYGGDIDTAGGSKYGAAYLRKILEEK